MTAWYIRVLRAVLLIENQRPFLEVFSGRRGIRTSHSATTMKIKAKDIRRMVVACSIIFFIHPSHVGCSLSIWPPPGGHHPNIIYPWDVLMRTGNSRTSSLSEFFPG
jgi:hypothetical protein